MNNIIIAFCSLFSFLTGTSNNRPDIAMTEKHISSFASKMNGRGFAVQGTGGAMMKNIEKVNMSFAIHKKVLIDEARIMIIGTSEDFLREINADEKLRPYLKNYPFDHKNLGFKIAFIDENNWMNETGIACVMVVKDKVYYEVSNSKTNPLITVYEESYAEALEKVKQQKSSVSN